MAEEWRPAFEIDLGPEEVDDEALHLCCIEAALEACAELRTIVHVAGGDFDREQT